MASNSALISNISERDRAKDLEQLDDIMWTLNDETNRSENRFGTVKDEDRMLAVKNPTPESVV